MLADQFRDFQAGFDHFGRPFQQGYELGEKAVAA
jgi:hypothetical protein